MRLLTFLAILLLLPMGTTDARELSLAEAEQLARDYSLRLKQARLQTEAAGGQRDAAVAARYPTLTLTGRVGYVDDVPSLTVDLPVGDPIVRELGTTENYQADLLLTFPLYTGGRIASTVQAGEALVALREALAEATLDQVTFTVRATYLAAYRANRLVAASEAALERAEIIQTSVASMAQAGAADSVALLEAKLGVTEADLTLKEHQTKARQESIRLQILLGLDPSETIELVDSFAEPAIPPATVTTIVRPEQQAVEAKVAQARADLRAQASGYLPELSLYGGYSVGKPNRDLFNKDWDDYFTVGVQASWSFNIGNQTEVLVGAARADLRRAELERDHVADDLSEAARLALTQWEIAYEQFLTARQRVTIAAATYRLAEAQHAAGALTTNRLLEVQQDLTRAEAARAAALANYHIARAAYSYAIGAETF